MSDEFYCILKLVSGEEILSLISVDDNDNDPMIVLQNPITVRLVHNYSGAHIKVKPWMDLSNDDIFMIRLDKVMTMSETTDEKLIQIYNDYIKEELEEEDVVTQEIIIGGTTYLIDEENNLYSVDTHEEMGTYNPETQEISREF